MLKFENSAMSSVFLLPTDIEKHLKNAGEAELKVILYIFSHGGRVSDEKEIATALSLSENDVFAALAFWRGTGILTYAKDDSPSVTVVSETKKTEKTVSYSQKELADAINANEDVSSLMNFASQKIGKILTPTEQGIIYSLIDSLSLECDLVMGIIEYCCTDMDKKSVRYIEKTAISMHDDDGVDTYEKFEEYISAKKKEKTYEDTVRDIIGARNRAFTKPEREIIAGFARDGISDELLCAAYERTINNISKPSLSYMSKIIANWRSQGINSKSELDGMKPFDQEGASGAFRLEDFTERPDEE